MKEDNLKSAQTDETFSKLMKVKWMYGVKWERKMFNVAITLPVQNHLTE